MAARELANEPYLFTAGFFLASAADYAAMTAYRDASESVDPQAVVALLFSDARLPAAHWEEALAGYPDKYWDAGLPRNNPGIPGAANRLRSLERQEYLPCPSPLPRVLFGNASLVTVASVDGAANLCLDKSRFQVTATWQTTSGQSVTAQVVNLSPDTGYLWSFSPASRSSMATGSTTSSGSSPATQHRHGDHGQQYPDRRPHSHPPQEALWQPLRDTSAFNTCLQRRPAGCSRWGSRSGTSEPCNAVALPDSGCATSAANGLAGGRSGLVAHTGFEPVLPA